jgi:hypothetical protein
MRTAQANIVELPHSKIYVREDGICVVDVTDDLVITRKELSEILDAIELISGGNKMPVLSLFKPGNTADKTARELSSSARGSQFTKADAMIVHNITQKIIANFYMKFNKPDKPPRFFSSEEDAIEWLREFV